MKKIFKSILLLLVICVVSSQSYAQNMGAGQATAAVCAGNVPTGNTPAVIASGKIPLAVMLSDIDPDMMKPNPLVKSVRGQVTIYADHDNGLYGRSLYRTLLLTVRDALFKRTDTYYVSKEIGSYLTGVIVNATTVAVLQEVMQSGQTLFLGDYEISLDTSVQSPTPESPVYRFRNNRQQLDTSFSVEKAPGDLVTVIQQFYTNDPKNRDLVVNYYKDNYILRIFAAENFIDPWNHDISMNEALVMATYLGDLEQPLWGIADGNANLARALVKMR